MRRKTAAEKQMHGTFRADRVRAALQFPDAEGIASKPLTYVKANKLALQEWKRVAPHLEAEGVLQDPDVSLLASYCLLYARWRDAAGDVEKNGQTVLVVSQTRTGKTEKRVVNPSVRNEIAYQAALMKAVTKFGLNPLDRPRLEVPPDDDELDPLRQFINDGIGSDAT